MLNSTFSFKTLLTDEAKSAKMLPHQLQKMLLGRCLATTDPVVPQGAAVESHCEKSANDLKFSEQVLRWK